MSASRTAEEPTQHRTFPKIPGLDVSILGFGAMRLPTTGAPPRIDEEAAARVLHAALARGVNYVDTAWPYHGGESERFVGRALKGGWREKVRLATKCPVWEVERPADWERLLDAQLEKLDTDRIDFYLLHALDGERWAQVQALGGLEALRRARDDGRIGHLGFSFHGPLDAFRQIVDGADWEFCQIQLNYLDERYQAGVEGMRHAASRGLGVIAMEPLRGGALTKAPPPVEAIWARAGRPWTPAGWALRWVWSHPEVITVLSGMNALEQVEENVAAACAAAPLGPVDLAAVEEVKAFYRARMPVSCTTCGYCQPCPSGVAIPDVFAAWNAALMFESRTGPAFAYQHFVVEAGGGAERCGACRDCVPRCPQGIPIPDKLEEAHRYLTGS
jgi:predicted aldo/keto reductase-like oxidoreductase